MRTQSNPAAASGQPPNRWLLIGCAAVFLCHAIQVFSLLRLNHDSVRLLSMAWSAHTTGTYDVRGISDQYPPGYPAMVCVLLAAGLGTSFWLNTLNLFWLGAATASWFWMARQLFRLSLARSLLAAFLPLLSWVVIKHAPIPVSDIPYLGLSAFTLLALQQFWMLNDRLHWRTWVMALVLALAALQVRTVGLTLVAAVVLSLPLHPCSRRPVATFWRRPRHQTWLGGLLLAAVSLLLILLIIHTAWFDRQFLRPGSYFEKLLANQADPTGIDWREIMGYRLREIASLSINLPLPDTVPIVCAMVGLCMIAFMVWASIRCQSTHLPLILYAAFQSALLGLWPYLDPRFFMPLIPVAGLLALAAIPEAISLRTWRGSLVLAWLGIYALLGFAALGFSLRLTLAGADLAEKYSIGRYRLTYLVAFGFAPDIPHDSIDADWLAVLQAYEPRTVKKECPKTITSP